MSNPQTFNALLRSYLLDEVSSEEYMQLMQMIKSGDYDAEVKAKIDEMMSVEDGQLNINTERAHDLLYKILSTEKRTDQLIPATAPVKRLWLRSAAAAAVIGIISVGFWFFTKTGKITQEATKVPAVKNDIAPGGNKATLTLDDGSLIVLDNAATGTLSKQGSTKVTKINNGQLAYMPGTGATMNEIKFNKISTPRGGTYQVSLPDGTQAWLNAASSLRYPTAFTGKERRVELTGEVYFEVAKNAAMPFRVNVTGKVGEEPMEVEVLGTHFDINAYDEEANIKTSLLEGSVKVRKGIGTEMLKPGQQAQVTAATGIKIVKDADMDEVMAWKNGMFQFGNADIETVMKQIARWYDVEVMFEGKKPTGHFRGEVSRNVNASEMLKVLETSGVHFRIEGKKIVVMP